MNPAALIVLAIRWRLIAATVTMQGDGSAAHCELVAACMGAAEGFQVAHDLQVQVHALQQRAAELRKAAIGAAVLGVVLTVGAVATAWMG